MSDLLKNMRNPLIRKYNPIENNELLYYKIDKTSFIKHNKKNYKHYDEKKAKINADPELVLIV